jgi:hypothetical protein
MPSKRVLVSTTQVRTFFSASELLDYEVLRPLDHIRPNWDVRWDPVATCYKPEADSFADLLNGMVDDLAAAQPPMKYHDNEDRLAEYVRDGHLKWPIHKVGARWVSAEYDLILQQGGFGDIDQADLLQAAAGRIWAAIKRGQMHFDDMEESHRKMLSAVLSIIIYHRA